MWPWKSIHSINRCFPEDVLSKLGPEEHTVIAPLEEMYRGDQEINKITRLVRKYSNPLLDIK